MKLQNYLILVTLTGALAACGGGGSDCKAGLGVLGGCDKGSAVVNTAPVANAGGNQNVLTGAVVALSGTASLDAQNDPLSYSWRFDALPLGSKAVLVSSATAQPNFVADVVGAYTLRLVVSDGKLSSSPALVVVTAADKNEAPVANAGVDQSVLKGSLVTLDGTASTDPNRTPLDFTWALVSRPSGSAAVLSSLTTIKPTFVADVAGTYVASLRVSDGRETSPQVFTTVVVAESNAAPVAVVSANQNVVLGSTVTLDGSASTDANRDPLTYSWMLTTKPSGSLASLSSAASPKPTFVADVPGLYVASLKVNDGKVSSDNIAINTVTVSVVNSAPVAVVSANQNVLTGALVTLDGTGSTDANRDPLTYNWVLTAKPNGSAAVLAGANSPKPTFTADVAGTYVASLVVSDGSLSSAVAVGSVTASIINAAPVAVVSANQNVVLGSTVTLDGSASTDANRDPLTYSWVLTTRPNGSLAALSSATSSKPVFVADVPGLYVASLKVNDGKVFSDNIAITTVTASVANAAPVAVVSANQNVLTGALVTLDGTGSTDANRDPLTYNWILTTRPNGSAASLSSATSSKPFFVADVPGLYVASLKVNDGQVFSENIAITTVTASVANAAPVAVVSANQNVLTGALVTLDGTGSTDANRDPLTYNWVLTAKPNGSAAVLAGANSPKPTFTADVAGTYVASLVVSDGSLSSAVAVGSVTASIINAAPVAVVSANQNVVLGSTVTLDGSASTDANRDPLTYSWVLTTRPNGSLAALSSATSSKPVFVADVPGLYVASLKVNDGQVSSENIAMTTVTASVANSAPVAILSANQNVLTGALVTLDGTGSTDANRDPLSYNWVLTAKPNGSAAVLNGANSPRPTFTADVAGTYVASLVVSDGSLSSAVAVGSVTASNINLAPVAVVGPNQSVKLNTLVNLEGRFSYDPNRDTLTYKWALLSKPPGSVAALSSATAATPTFTADVAGTYVASLVVSDGLLVSEVVATTVQATALNAPPVAYAGPAQTVKVAASVTLDGSGSSDADGNVLTYAWAILYKPAGSLAALSANNVDKPTLMPDVAGVYVFTLVVNDGLANSAQSTVTVTAVP